MRPNSSSETRQVALWNFDFAIKTPLEKIMVQLTSNAPVLGIVGPSGSGKSSMLNALLGVNQEFAIEGNASCSTVQLFDTASKRYMPASARPFAWVPQQSRLLPHLNVLQNLMYGATAGAGPGQFHFDELMYQLKLSQLLQRSPANLSGGERQRVAIGRAWLSRGSMALFDEPMTSIDHGHRMQLLQLMSQSLHSRFQQAILISHDVEELRSLGAEIWALHNGHLKLHQ